MMFKLNEDEVCNYLGKFLCEDCYVRAVEPLRTCDVAAVHSAEKHREMAGQTGMDGLTQQQKEIYEYVKKCGKAIKQELCSEFGMPTLEMDKQMALLRHCEILKGCKIDNEVYIVPFDFE